MPQASSPQPATASPADGLRIAVVGARRVRNGTGPYLAREAKSLGGEVVSVLGTRPSTTEQACRELSHLGMNPEPFTHFTPMLEETHPDVLLVASPAGTHRPWLEAAADAGLHVLCEKPLLALFDESGKELIYRFAADGKVLAENCQWPFTFGSFRELHPGFDPSTASQFRMLMAPSDRGRTRWLETLSHPLSLLQHVFHGPAEIDQIRYEEASPSAPDSRLHFRFTVFQHAVDCEVVLEDTGQLPRPAEFAFDDYVCRRRIEPPNYQFFFDSGFVPVEAEQEPARKVAAEDPLYLRAKDFFERVAKARKTGNAPVEEDFLRRQQLLDRLLTAYQP
jgi:predicted dehydrogenase